MVAAEEMLKPGGRLVIVTFHSLEDRIAKQFLAERSGNLPSASRYAPGPLAERPASFVTQFKGHVAAGEAELSQNPRARSAKLRAAMRTSAEAWGKQGAFMKSVAALRAQLMLKWCQFHACCCDARITASMLYSLEHVTRGYERDITRAKAQMNDNAEAIKLLKAEWSSLTRPERLAATCRTTS